MLDVDEFDRWMKSARKTLESAERDFIGGDYNWSCFKSHQAAEKAIKALLWGIGYPEIGHSLPNLMKRLEEKGIKLPPKILEESIRLNKYYIPTRYPDAWSEGIPEEYYTKKEALEALEYAKDIMYWVDEIWRRLSKKERE